MMRHCNECGGTDTYGHVGNCPEANEVDMQQIVYICDDCGERFEAEEGADLKEAWGQAKEEDWVCYCKDGEWVHKCGECRSNK